MFFWCLTQITTDIEKRRIRQIKSSHFKKKNLYADVRVVIFQKMLNIMSYERNIFKTSPNTTAILNICFTDDRKIQCSRLVQIIMNGYYL